MKGRTKYNISNDGNIYRNSTHSFANNNEKSNIPYVLLEFITDCQLDIGDYRTIDKADYPKVNKITGERIYAFLDRSRNGYCYDHRVHDMTSVISIFIPSETVQIII